MKTAFSAIATATVLGVVFYLLGRPLDIVDYVLILFATSIVIWTFEQYNPHQPPHGDTK